MKKYIEIKFVLEDGNFGVLSFRLSENGDITGHFKNKSMAYSYNTTKLIKDSNLDDKLSALIQRATSSRATGCKSDFISKAKHAIKELECMR